MIHPPLPLSPNLLPSHHQRRKPRTVCTAPCTARKHATDEVPSIHQHGTMFLRLADKTHLHTTSFWISQQSLHLASASCPVYFSLGLLVIISISSVSLALFSHVMIGQGNTQYSSVQYMTVSTRCTYISPPLCIFRPPPPPSHSNSGCGSIAIILYVHLSFGFLFSSSDRT